MTRFLTFVAMAAVSLTGCYLAELYALPKLGAQTWTFGEVFGLWAILFTTRVILTTLLLVFKAEAKS